MEDNEEIKDLVIARFKTLPEGMVISVGGEGEFSRDDLIRHIEAGDNIGKKMVEVEMSFLRSLKDGVLYDFK